MKGAFVILLLLIGTSLFSQESITVTYNAGDIPTSFNVYNPSCNGPMTALSITLPNGVVLVSGVMVTYNMTAASVGWMADQRTKIRCVNTNLEEPEVAGTGNMPGTFIYSRNINIANGQYSGGPTLVFEMNAMRVFDGVSGCNTITNKIDDGTWTITVYYGILTNVGVNETQPLATLDVAGKLKIADDINPAIAGMIRWNEDTDDFEGFDGTSWRSLIRESGGWGADPPATESIQFPGGNHLSYFGKSVSIAGDYSLVGAYGEFGSMGRAHIFHKNGSVWDGQTLAASDGVAADVFGYSVSISGDYAVVGAHGHDTGGNNFQGKCYVFVRTGTVWTEQTMLTSSDGAALDLFGFSVGISGDYIIVGAQGHDTGGNSSQGKAYIYHRSGNIWNQQAILTASDGDVNNLFGASVAISGNYAVIGAHGANGSQGKAYVFNRTGTVWTQQSILVASDGAPMDIFGSQVAIDGDHVLIGSPDHNTNGNYFQGKAYMYQRSGSTWIQQTMLVASDGNGGSHFGSGVSISGDYAIVGAYLTGLSVQKGKAYIYKKTGTNWIQETILVASDGGGGHHFGEAVSISGTNAIVGAPYHGPFGDQRGMVYFY